MTPFIVNVHAVVAFLRDSTTSQRSLKKYILCEISIFDYVEVLINDGFAQVSPKTHKKMNSSKREVYKTMID